MPTPSRIDRALAFVGTAAVVARGRAACQPTGGSAASHPSVCRNSPTVNGPHLIGCHPERHPAGHALTASSGRRMTYKELLYEDHIAFPSCRAAGRPRPEWQGCGGQL
ncbi:hypothetical protein BRAO285_620155 [Bradyrhizobium sp. ORS 285]|nr:hypothetical protein BRAO285_620155 [Bradyrhizobium sp. ORS 285]